MKAEERHSERFHNPKMRRGFAEQDLKLPAVLKPSVEMG